MRTRTRRGLAAARDLLPRVVGILALILCQASCAQWPEALAPDSPLLHPGKADVHYTLADDTHQYNLIAWSPVFKGGVGAIDVDGGEDTFYAGGYVRPFVQAPDWGDLILGFQGVDGPPGDAYEFQGEYRLPMGLGVGGGYVDRGTGRPETVFGKISFRNEWNDWHYILSAQGQEDNERISPGGYAAVYNEEVMVTGGSDGEQWRACAGYVWPAGNGRLRPAAEVLYVDNDIGQLAGPRFLFINGTLGFGGGFLSHPARLGRAMGPTGLEFGNPLGFLQPTWNRRLDVWELGTLLDLRGVRLDLPDGTVQEKYEAVVFPFQIDRLEGYLDGLFVGGFGARTPADEGSGGILGGIVGKLGFLTVNLAVEQDLGTGDTRFSVGVIGRL